jgi:hypothetical protein
MPALRFLDGSIAQSETLVDLEIWEMPTEDNLDVFFQLVVQSDLGDRYIVLEVVGEANRSTVEAKRDALATHLWGTVIDVTTI